MPVETIECQIVQAQLGRYLSGEPFSHEAVSQLEEHIADCQICRQEVAVRRATLQSLLGPSAPAVGRPDALIGALRESQAASMKTIPTQAVVEQVVPESVSLSPKRFSKPMMFGSALAVVLIAMSYIGKNPTSIFGDRAATSTALTAPATQSPTVQAADPAPAPAAEPLIADEWSTMGLAEVMPFDSSDAETLEPWAWFALSESLTEATDADAPATDPTAEVEASNDATLDDWELFGVSAALEPTPTPSSPAPAVKTSPRKKTSKAAPKANTNTIRLYEPGQ